MLPRGQSALHFFNNKMEITSFSPSLENRKAKIFVKRVGASNTRNGSETINFFLEEYL